MFSVILEEHSDEESQGWGGILPATLRYFASLQYDRLTVTPLYKDN